MYLEGYGVDIVLIIIGLGTPNLSHSTTGYPLPYFRWPE
jgi:hypothetical protein